LNVPFPQLGARPMIAPFLQRSGVRDAALDEGEWSRRAPRRCRAPQRFLKIRATMSFAFAASPAGPL